MTAEQFKQFSDDHSQEEIEAYVDKITFSSFNVMVRASFSTYNGETSCKYSAIKVLPYNEALESRALITRMKLYQEKDMDADY